MKDCDADRLFVFATAERAQECGDNPPALFADILKNDRRAFITQDQEDRTRRRLRRAVRSVMRLLMCDLTQDLTNG